ncbi:TnsD family Tn7-like transposition protein [Pelagerythrobacter aerophilus]|uniref:Uncharacterized protein n=3 Tax=Pelagerythrobacter aerophilus TaxID=2306995 RepID=A0A418NKG7_9SPHN|nr:TnsD family Tn7-like transposition protein [Pelagerythrobacter aerophilus]RIV79943.1 hypothetical protein D2V04_03675 [Pelagerythrobacter aerophilus]
MDWLPEPYPGETFYSMLVRLHRYLGRPPYASFARAIAGRRQFVALCHLPCDLAAVAERFGWPDEQLDQLIHSTTTYGYHTAFASQTVRERALRQMKGQGASLQFTLGLSTFPVPMPGSLQFCRDCVADVLDRAGEAWWLRWQQLPGVLVCAEHGTWLYRSSAELNPRKRHSLMSPDEAAEMQSGDLSCRSNGKPPPPKLVELARLSRALLDAPPEPNGPAGQYQHYRHMLADRGLLRGTQHLRASRIQQLVSDYWGETLEMIPGLSLGTDEGPNWVTDLLRNRRKLAPPAQHLVLQTALEQVPEVERPFGPPPWLCLNPLAEHFEKPVVTRQRLVRDRGKLHGHFTCSCGYSYSRTRRPDGAIGRPRIRQFGPEAGRFLRQAAASGLSLRGKARAMRVDPMTVKRLEQEVLQKPESKCQGEFS